MQILAKYCKQFSNCFTPTERLTIPILISISVSLFKQRHIKQPSILSLGLVLCCYYSHPLNPNDTWESKLPTLNKNFQVLAEKHSEYSFHKIQFFYKTEVVLFFFGNENTHVQRWIFFSFCFAKRKILVGKNIERSAIAVMLE